MRCRHSHEYTCSLDERGECNNAAPLQTPPGKSNNAIGHAILSVPPPADDHASFHGDAAFSSLEDGPGHRSRMMRIFHARIFTGVDFFGFKRIYWIRGNERFFFFVVVYFYTFYIFRRLDFWKKKNFSVERPVVRRVPSELG